MNWFQRNRNTLGTTVGYLMIVVSIYCFFHYVPFNVVKAVNIKDENTKACQTKWPNTVAVENGTHWYCQSTLGELK